MQLQRIYRKDISDLIRTITSMKPELPRISSYITEIKKKNKKEKIPKLPHIQAPREKKQGKKTPQGKQKNKLSNNVQERKTEPKQNIWPYPVFTNGALILPSGKKLFLHKGLYGEVFAPYPPLETPEDVNVANKILMTHAFSRAPMSYYAEGLGECVMLPEEVYNELVHDYGLENVKKGVRRLGYHCVRLTSPSGNPRIIKAV